MDTHIAATLRANPRAEGVSMPQRLPSPARPFVVSLTWLVLALVAIILSTPSDVWAKRTAPVCTPLVPCTDPRGCPDLTIDPGILLASPVIDIHTFAASDCAVVEGEAIAGTRKMLLFSTQSNNRGPGALFLGNPADHPEWFEFATCHGHYHIKDYADYRLWTVAGYDQWKALRTADPGLCAKQVFDRNPALQAQFINGHKLGLCFYDVLRMAQAPNATEVCPRTLDPQTYFGCDYAGLGVCWADIYEPVYGFVDGQWIDVTDVPDGDYVLENESNATRLITESDYTNNSAGVLIRLRNRNVRILGPR
jgi:hypothetical protein